MNMHHLDTLIQRYYDGLITHEDLEALVFEEARITASEIVSPNSLEFIGVWESLSDEYATYVAKTLGG